MLATLLWMALLAFIASVQGVNAQDGSQPPSNYNTVRIAHAALGSVAWVIFFPLGAIIIRVLSSPKTWLVHACIMTFAWAIFIVCTGLGIYMSLVSQQLNGYHPIIGLLLLALVSLQLMGGLLHHHLWSERKKSEIVAMYHIWMGRVLITLGIIDGGLGLLYSGNTTSGEKIAYGVIAGVIWVSWIIIVIAIPAKRGKEIPGTINHKKRASDESALTALSTSPEDRSEKGSF